MVCLLLCCFSPHLPAELGNVVFAFSLESSSEAVCFPDGRGVQGEEGALSHVGHCLSVSVCLSVCLSLRRTELSELCHALQLLQDLVERTSPQHRALYQGQPSGLPGLAQGDLEVMEAMVLQQLQQAVSPRIGSLSEEHSRDRDALRTLLGDHGLFLKQHRVQLPEGVAEMFEQLLASGEEGQDSQVLREALPEEPGTVQSDESSLVLPSILTNGGEGKQREQREPGRDPSHDSPEGSTSPGTHLESSCVSDGSTPPSSRTELRKGTVAAIKSKAFWGESEDSSSELEAALRPQTHGADSDDFDDFYD